jgi:nucleoside-diphosphate-sugar epimerase
MRVLIIGGTSFIGPHVVKLLCSLGHQVTVFHRGQTNEALPDTVNHIFGDRKNIIKFSEDFKSFSPDVVLDMIPSSKEDAKLVVNTFKNITQRVVAISSQDVYRAYGLVREFEFGDLELIPIYEQSDLRQRLYPYQDSSKDKHDWTNTYDKILVEQVIMGDSDIAGTILRLPAVYGPLDNQHRFFSYLNLKRMMDKRPHIFMDESFAQWRWTHAYVENVAFAITLAVVDNRSSGKIYNVGDPITLSMHELVKEIGEKINWHGEIILLPKNVLPELLRFPLDTKQQLVTDSKLIRQELNFHEIVSWEEGLHRTIEWEIKNMDVDIDPKYQNFNYQQEDDFLKQLNK